MPAALNNRSQLVIQKTMRDEDARANEAVADLAAVFQSPQVADGVKNAAPAAYAAAERFWRSANSRPALEPRLRELVLVALQGTVTSLHGEGVRRHAGRALAAGATHADVIDVLLTISAAANHALYFAVPVLMRELEAAGHPEADIPPITAECQAAKDEFLRVRGFWNEHRDVIARVMPDYFVALSDLSTETWKNGALTDKERELVCIAIDCTVTHMFEPGLAMHIRHAVQKGARREEILEVFHLASLTGLEGFILGADALFAPESATPPA